MKIKSNNLNELQDKLPAYCDQLAVMYKLLDWKWGEKGKIPDAKQLHDSCIRNLFSLITENHARVESGGLYATKEEFSDGIVYYVGFDYVLNAYAEEENNE